MNTSIIDELVGKVTEIIQGYGWYAVFMYIIWYMIQPYLAEWRRTRSLAQARDPERCRVFDAEVKRIRAKQSLDSLKRD
jgi:hypothetical protein